MTPGQAQPDGTEAVAHHVADVLPQVMIEPLQIALSQSVDLLIGIRVATDGPLSKDHERPREDVGPLHGNAYRRAHIGMGEQVARTANDSVAAENIHPVVDDLALQLGGIVFGHRRDHGRLGALIESAARIAAHGLEHVRIAPDPGQRLFDALEPADLKAELFAYGRVRRGHAVGELRAAGTLCRQGDAAAGGQRFHQHAPPVSGPFPSADDGIDRQHDVMPFRRRVDEGHAEGIVAPSGLHAFCVAGHERAGDPRLPALPQQVVGVLQLERQAEDRGDGRQRYVPLSPVETQVELVVLPPKDDALRRNGSGIRPGLGLGQGEGRNLFSSRQPRQVMVALRLRAVMDQQFGRAERVGHHHRDGERQRSRGGFHHHGTVGRRRKLETSVLFRNDHPEEPLLLEKRPYVFGQISALEHVPVIGHRADLLDRSVQECPLLVGELRVGLLHQLSEIGAAREQVPIHPHRAGLDGDPLGFGDARQKACGLEQLHDGGGDDRTAQRNDVEHDGRDAEDDPQPYRRAEAVENQRPCERVQPQRCTEVAERADGQHDQGEGPTDAYRVKKMEIRHRSVPVRPLYVISKIRYRTMRVDARAPPGAPTGYGLWVMGYGLQVEG